MMHDAPKDRKILLYGLPQHTPTLKQGPRWVIGEWNGENWQEVCTAWTGPRVVAYKWAPLPEVPPCDT